MKNNVVNGIRFSDNTSYEVIKAVQKCMHLDIRVKIDFGNANTGEFSNQADNAFGYIKAKADGDTMYPLLVNDRKSMEGEPLRDDEIIRIEGSNSAEGGVIYEHPNYHKKHKKTSKQAETQFRQNRTSN
ncbi:MAG TPA: hypothetical protein VHP30_03005 [Ignavibacteriales bacterium]|nr:hypothetical protein [Ignavibacteriales bacterium]